MSSDPSFVEYVCDQISGAGRIAFRKMFGEYVIYCDGKVIALVCDNQFFVKPTTGGRALIGTVTEGLPYPGAKPYFLIGDELDDREWVTQLVRVTAREVPPPKPKKPRQAKKFP
jgi:TfoX/Sxy family transcriptional regulator of competence genes